LTALRAACAVYVNGRSVPAPTLPFERHQRWKYATMEDQSDQNSPVPSSLCCPTQELAQPTGTLTNREFPRMPRVRYSANRPSGSSPSRRDVGSFSFCPDDRLRHTSQIECGCRWPKDPPGNKKKKTCSLNPSFPDVRVVSTFHSDIGELKKMRADQWTNADGPIAGLAATRSERYSVDLRATSCRRTRVPEAIASRAWWCRVNQGL